MSSDHWQKYWSSQQDPHHASNELEFYSRMGREVLFHTGPLAGKKVLEIGCGDGALFPHFDVNIEDYTGVDFSESLLAKFQQRFPAVRTVHSDAIGFMENNLDQFDVVISFGVLQYLDANQLKIFFDLQKGCIVDKGLAGHFGIPVKELSSVFYRGLGSSPLVLAGRKRGLGKRLSSRLRNKIGHWHDFETLISLARPGTSRVDCVSSMSYFYRCHLLQQF
ncbi:MAG: class I SAM-dependent methyltransferase [Immundisolibacteraceae bacterium]|nr:class I SAM-dependent methyltransferase [Immundisolibacteraceae bacterium]